MRGQRDAASRTGAGSASNTPGSPPFTEYRSVCAWVATAMRLISPVSPASTGGERTTAYVLAQVALELGPPGRIPGRCRRVVRRAAAVAEAGPGVVAGATGLAAHERDDPGAECDPHPDIAGRHH